MKNDPQSPQEDKNTAAEPTRTVRIRIPQDIFGTLVDFCIEMLGHDDVPGEDELATVAGYLLERGIRTFDGGDERAGTPVDDVAS